MDLRGQVDKVVMGLANAGVVWFEKQDLEDRGYDSRGSRQNVRLFLLLREAGGVGISCGRCKAW